MEIIHINNSEELITKNFKINEFWDTSFSHTKIDFDMPKCLADAAQILRDYFKIPLTITSAYRPTAAFGYHITGEAIDINPIDFKQKVNTLKVFKEECLKYIEDESSELIKSLRSIGITGFGVEMACVHLDVRNNHFSRRDNIGKYTIFEYRQGLDGKVLINKSL